MTSPQHLLDIDDLGSTLADVLERSLELKAAHRAGESYRLLPDRSLAMIFEKPSTRTRISFEAGMTRLGGHAIVLTPDHMQLDRGEPISDTARVLSRYVDGVMARVNQHATVAELAKHATIPVINGLSDIAHPCQTLADLLTIREEFGDFSDVNATWIGDGNNVAASFVIGCAMVGIDLTIASPQEYELPERVLTRAAELGSRPEILRDPRAAVEGADVVYTDVWVSMGDDDERTERLERFRADGYQVNAELVPSEIPVMHCLPAHRGEEITEEMLMSDQALVWDQAENRMHAQNGLLVELLAA